jgi:uncharacterized membrane protein
MWFLGLIVGAILGGIGGGTGSVVGAMAGAAVGWTLSKQTKMAAADRLGVIEAQIQQINQRIDALERGTVAESAPPLFGDTTVPEPIPASAPSQPTTSIAVTPAAEAVSEASAAHQEDDAQPAFAAEPEKAISSGPSLPQAPSALWNFFFGGNTLVRFGVIVLFFGVAFLLKYAAENMSIPIEVRLMGVALGAVVLLAIGWRVRESRPGYGLIMQGGGIGVLYLTVFASFRLYQLLPAGAVLLLLAAMAAFSAMLAVLQDSRSLATMGISGGFLAPLLASTGGGSHVMLFSFYAMLNFGILAIAWYKAWRALNLLGFVFTFIIGLAWGSKYYRPELFASTEPFLILFFLFYVAIAVLFAIRQEASIKSEVDGTLVFGTPLIAFGLQTALARDIEYGAAFSALALSFFYLVLAKILFARGRANLRLLTEAFIALGVVFGTLAIPLALDGRWTAAAWALEGAAIVWVGVRQGKILARWFGVLLQFGAGAAFLFDASGAHAGLPVLNSFYLGCVFISLAGLFCAWYLRRRRDRVSEAERLAAFVLFGWGVLWWYGAGANEINDHVMFRYYVHAVLIFVVISCALFSILHTSFEWREARYAALALLPLMVILAAVDAVQAAHPFEFLGYLGWPLAFGAHLWLLQRHEKEGKFLRWWHSGGLWLVAALGAWELAWLIGDVVRGGSVWRLIGWAMVPGAIVAWLTAPGERLAWPVARHLDAYLWAGAIPLVIYLWLWMTYANLNSNGDADPLPYLPLLNPLDITQAGALLALFAWFGRVRGTEFTPQELRAPAIAAIALGSAAFFWLNGVLLRALHHWAGVPFDLDVMLHSMLVQTSFSIFWSLLALCTMLCATRLRLRPLWLTGAGLMAVVVAKLFFVDLSNVGGIERIVSFIGVGLLMLVIGYVSPVPPSTTEEGK